MNIRDYCRPMAEVPVDEARVHHVHACLSPIWETKNRTAVRLKERINLVLDHAQAMEYREDNPVEKVVRLLPKVRASTQHLGALPHNAVAEAIAKVRGANHVAQGAKLAFEFMVLTATRNGETIGAVWSEIDLEGAVWSIPGDRMKNGKPHKVPLSTRAIAILEQARKLHDGDLVFVNDKGKALRDYHKGFGQHQG